MSVLSRVGTRSLLAIIVAVAVCVSLATTPGARATALATSSDAVTVAPCTSVQFIAVRDSGENPSGAPDGYPGALLGPVTALAAGLAPPDVTTSVYGLPYPAADVLPGDVSGGYDQSVAAGDELLKAYVEAAAAQCPAMKLVVLGYGQGALVLDDVLPQPPLVPDPLVAITSDAAEHVAAVVRFGDPLFNPDAPGSYGTFDAQDHGLEGTLDAGYYDSYGDNAGSWCRHDDLICQGLGEGHTIDQHQPDRYLADSAGWVAGWLRGRLGWPLGGVSVPLDLAFAIDSTGSMSSSIEYAVTAAAKITQAFSDGGADLRVGLVDYLDTDQGDPYPARVDVPFTGDVQAFNDGLAALRADGGGDDPEGVYSGMMTAFTQLSWRDGSRRALIVIGDAPGKDPEPVTGYTRASVSAALDQVVVYTIPVRGQTQTEDFMAALAAGTGGQMFPAATPTDVANEVVVATQVATVRLNAALAVSAPAHVGQPVSFSAAGSWYDSDTGSLSSYAWDFDGDGTADATTTVPEITRTFDVEVAATATVTVSTSDGRSAVAGAFYTVLGTPPAAAAAPGSLTLTLSTGADGSRRVTAQWVAPADTGGSAIAGYDVTVADQAGAVVRRGTVPHEPTATSVVLRGLPVGTDTVSVAAVTDAGDGAAASAQITVPPDDRAPVAQARRVSTVAGVPVAVTVAATDPDSDPLHYRLVHAPARGQLSGTAPKWTYKPATRFVGTDQFTFTASDGPMTSAAATVTVTVAPVPTLDRRVFALRVGRVTSVTAPALTTSAHRTTLLAIVTGTTVSGRSAVVVRMSGGGLVWRRVARSALSSSGHTAAVAEVWKAYTTRALSRARIVARFRLGVTDPAITVSAFSHASTVTAVAAVGAASTRGGQPLTTVRSVAAGGLIVAGGVAIASAGRAPRVRAGAGTQVSAQASDTRRRVLAWAQTATTRPLRVAVVTVRDTATVASRVRTSWALGTIALAPGP